MVVDGEHDVGRAAKVLGLYQERGCDCSGSDNFQYFYRTVMRLRSYLSLAGAA